LLYLAWRYGGNDPYRLHNGLDAEMRPVGGGEVCPPPRPWRVKAFLFGCGIAAHEEEIEKTQAVVGGAATRGIM
jgi:hypothetical protein